MIEEKILNRAFNEAMHNEAVNYLTPDVDTKVVKTIMRAYLDKRDLDITDEELEDYIRQSFLRLQNALKDFSYNNGMMIR